MENEWGGNRGGDLHTKGAVLGSFEDQTSNSAIQGEVRGVLHFSV